MEYIDFSNCKILNKTFGGANGSKISIIYNNDFYMLKLPTLAKVNEKMHYSNSIDSEYLCCKIGKILNYPTQEVLLGKYKHKNKEYDAVACKDFTRNGWNLQDFASLKNTVVDSKTNGHNTDIYEILNTINLQTSLDQQELVSYFWDLFVFDSFIGNWDRHNGNWGFLYNENTDEIKLAPIYDCGSSLYPQADDSIILEVNKGNEDFIKPRIYNVPTSAIFINKKRINYFDVLNDPSFGDKSLSFALQKFQENYNTNKISELFHNFATKGNKSRINFYIKMLNLRKELIVDNACKQRNISIRKDIIKDLSYNKTILNTKQTIKASIKPAKSTTKSTPQKDAR